MATLAFRPYIRFCFSCLLGYTPGLLAQGAPGLLEEVVVTARKREQNLGDVGLTMSALGPEEFKRLAALSLPDLTNSLPNVELFEDYGGHGLPVWVIRGVGLQDFNANNTPTAALYLDEVYQVSNVMGAISLFDAERVEVLKGPQGGLYGRNTSGGAVTVQTRRPTLDSREGYASAALGSWQTWTFEGASNLPLGERAALRVAGQRLFSNDAWQDSLVNGEAYGEKDLWNVRSWLLYEPAAGTRVHWKIHAGANESELNLGRAIGIYSGTGPGHCAAVLSGRRDDATCHTLAGVAALLAGEAPVLPGAQAADGSTSLSQPVNALDNDYLGTTLIVEHEIGELLLTSISNSEAFTYGADFDFDGTPLEFGHSLAGSEISAWSQELRLASPGTGALSWILGALVSGESLEEDREFHLRDSIVSPLQIGQLIYEQETDAWALYGDLAYNLTDTVNLNATLRYTDEEKRYRDGSILAPAFPPPFNVLASGLSSDYTLDSNLAGNLGLDWRVNPDLLLYASFSKGFKSGGFYGGFPLDPGDTDPYKEESVLAWEAGFKRQFGARAVLNGAAFHYDYRDVQGYLTRFSQVTGTNLEFLSNQGDATHQGLELELFLALNPNFSLNAGAAWLDARITKSRANTVNLLGQLVPVQGRRPYAPKWSSFLGLQYSRVLAGGMQVDAGLDYSYRTDFAGALSSPADRAVFRLEGFGLLNGTLFLSAPGNDWNVGLWGKNLADEEYVPRVVFDSFGDYIDIPGEPRSFGLKAELQW